MGNERIGDNVNNVRIRLVDYVWPEVSLPEDTRDAMRKFYINVQFGKGTQR
jgi:choline kinase